MGCNNTPAVEENPLNNSNSGINPNLEDESQFLHIPFLYKK